MKLIVACDPRGGIGYQNSLPWKNLSGDLARFRTLTTGQVVVMGRNTWESLPKKPLPNRLNFVVTSKELDLSTDALVVSDLSSFKTFKSAWLIGGAQLINSNWDMIDEIHLSRTTAEYTCDKFIDLVQLENDFENMYTLIFDDHTYEFWKRK